MYIQSGRTWSWKRKKRRKKGLYTSWERPTLIQQIGPAAKNPPPTCIDKILLGLTTKLPPEEKQKREERKTVSPLMSLARAMRLMRSSNRTSTTATCRKEEDLRTARTGPTTPHRTPVDHGRRGEKGHAATRGHGVNKSIKGDKA